MFRFLLTWLVVLCFSAVSYIYQSLIWANWEGAHELSPKIGGLTLAFLFVSFIFAAGINQIARRSEARIVRWRWRYEDMENENQCLRALLAAQQCDGKEARARREENQLVVIEGTYTPIN